jgi:hypothetical protein
MIHPPTQTHGPLQSHELGELADLLDDLEVFIASLEVTIHLLTSRTTSMSFN